VGDVETHQLGQEMMREDPLEPSWSLSDPIRNWKCGGLCGCGVPSGKLHKKASISMFSMIEDTWQIRELRNNIGKSQKKQLLSPSLSLILCLVLVVLGFELRASYLVGRLCTTWATSLTLCLLLNGWRRKFIRIGSKRPRTPAYPVLAGKEVKAWDWLVFYNFLFKLDWNIF
jgi:hypothetical protein